MTHRWLLVEAADPGARRARRSERAAGDTVPAKRPITLRDLLTFTLGTGMVLAEPGTIPIADALNALQDEEPEPPPDEWIRRLGRLPLVCQPGERWMYEPPPT